MNKHIPNPVGIDASGTVPDYEPAYGSVQNDDGLFDFDLRAVLAALKRNRLWVAGALILALGAGVLISVLTVPLYVARSQVLVEQQADQILEGSDTSPATSYADADRFLQTQVDIINSTDLAKRVVDSEGLASNPAFFDAVNVEMPTAETLAEQATPARSLDEFRAEVAVEALRKDLQVVLPKDSRLISIGIETRSAEWSARLANAYANNYISGNLSRKFDSSSYAREYLAQQLKAARDELENSERELNSYARVAGLVRVPGQGEDGKGEGTLSITTNSLVQLNQSAGLATADRVTAENKWRSIANAPILNIPEVLENPAMQSLIRQKSDLEGKLAQESATHLADHPNVVALKAQISDINSDINNLGQSLKRSVRLEYQAALDREKDLNGKVAALRSDALSEQDLGVRFNVLKRQADTKRDLYDTLLERYNQISATAGASSNNISLVDEATVPRKPSSPNIFLNMFLALVAGIILAALIVFVREYFDDTIRAPEDVENKLDLPLLGLIPQSESDDIQEELADPKSPISEAYVTLLTNLRLSTPHGISQVLAFISSQASEGKSTTARAMAEELAKLGKRTLLIDGDMRRPTIQRLNLPGLESGLGDYLAGAKEFADVVVPSRVPNLDLISALPLPPHPPVLLNNRRLDELIELARDKYDNVLFDCPPMLGLSDTAILANKVDDVVLIIDAQAGHRGSIKAAIRRLRLIHASIIGAVLTKFDPNNGNTDYTYEYYRYGD